MFVPFNDLSRIHKPLLNKSLKNLEKTVLKNDLILSEDIRLFEEKYSEFTNQKYTVSCANGTDAIELILRALEIGIGDEVIVPTNSFIATAVAVVRTGAKPVFVDNNNDYLIDVSSVEKIFPNPIISNRLNVVLKNVEVVENLYFLSINGNRTDPISSQQIGRNLIIDVSNIKAGIYFLRIYTKNELIRERVRILK